MYLYIYIHTVYMCLFPLVGVNLAGWCVRQAKLYSARAVGFTASTCLVLTQQWLREVGRRGFDPTVAGPKCSGSAPRLKRTVTTQNKN